MSTSSSIDKQLLDFPEIRTPAVVAIAKAEMHLHHAKENLTYSRELENVQACLNTLSCTKATLIADIETKGAGAEGDQCSASSPEERSPEESGLPTYDPGSNNAKS